MVAVVSFSSDNKSLDFMIVSLKVCVYCNALMRYVRGL